MTPGKVRRNNYGSKCRKSADFGSRRRPYRGAMSTETHKPEPAGGDGLLMMIAAALLVVVAVEAAMMVIGGWAMMVATLVVVLLAALAVIGALIRTMND